MSRRTVLSLLLSGPAQGLSGEELSRRLGVSRAAVWKEIQVLRKVGYRIDAAPHTGYRLISSPDRVIADELEALLGDGRTVGSRILCYEELDSTNSTAFALAEKGCADGTCVLAEHQKGGKGRLGRTWSSPKAQNLLLSVVLRPRMSPMDAPRLTLASAVCVVRAIKRLTGLDPRIKWPNDLLLGDRKLCGILTEMSAETDRVAFVVVGIGLNVNSDPDRLPEGAVSLAAALGHAVRRAPLAAAILEELDKAYADLREGRFGGLAEAWEEHSATTGRRVTAHLPGRTLHGSAQGIDADGALWIRTDSGLQERVLTGDVVHLRERKGGA
ncbi:MAG: Bifunctional ligase/repressor BirA [Candidatus Omnitrophica bacterium]|nr:Bifunctional ligase/repressor BirA [Candidatus Omnitrophota bacterium]